MTNPFQAILDEGKELIVLGFFVIICLIILGTLITIPGITPEAKAVAEQGQQTISWLWMFYLGLPSVGVIVAIVIWVVKKTENQNSFY